MLDSTTYKLLRATKSWAKSHNFKYVWHSMGKILIKKNGEEQAIHISTVEELKKFEVPSTNQMSQVNTSNTPTIKPSKLKTNKKA